jgi:hypothetical protein
MSELAHAIALVSRRNGWPEHAFRQALERESGLRSDFELWTTDTKTGKSGPCLSLSRPKHVGVGLLGWNSTRARQTGIAGTRSALEWILSLSPSEQVALAERFFQRASRPLTSTGDFQLVLMGASDALEQASDYPVARKHGTSLEHRRYLAFSELDRDGDGVVTRGDIIGAEDKPAKTNVVPVLLLAGATALLLSRVRRSKTR